jgi:hypothetical protein
MQRVIQRSDALSVVPNACNDNDRASNEVLRFVLGGAHDDDSDEDLYETLISKGLVDKNKTGAKGRTTVEEDSWTASCTESYSSSWSASMHDSFGQEASHPLQYPPPPQPYTSPSSHSCPVPGSPRRRRRRRGSFDKTAMVPFMAPPLTASEGKGSDQPSPPPPPPPPPLPPSKTTTTASAAAASSVVHSRARPPRRKHGSFLDSSSTSCCLNDIVEETENTESSVAVPDELRGGAAEDFVASRERYGGASVGLQWSGRRVRFGQVEIRSYGVTLDQVGGYGLEGKPVFCPLTLDWRYDGSNTVRKPAILFGYSSYFQQAKRRPTTVDERRARIGVLHHMRQPQVKRWEYRALLYQMAALQSKGGIPERWQDDFDGGAVGDDRVPKEPTRCTADIDVLLCSWRESIIELPPERGVDLTIVPMQWIDHNSRPKSVQNDSWTPLDPVSLDVDAREKEMSSSHRANDESRGHSRECTRHCMPTMPSLWLHDPQIVRASEDNSKDLDGPDSSPSADFQVVLFEPIVTSKVREKASVGCSSSTAKTKEWKRSPPGRSIAKKIVRSDFASEASPTPPMPRVPFQWITLKVVGCETQDPTAVHTKSPHLSDPEVPPVLQSSEFRKVPFEDLVTAACLNKKKPSRTVSPGRSAVTKGRSLDEVEWRRCLRSPSTMWWTRNITPMQIRHDSASRTRSTTGSDDRSLESFTWLEELTKIHRSRQEPIPASVQAKLGATTKEAEQLWLAMVNSCSSEVNRNVEDEGLRQPTVKRNSREGDDEGDCDHKVCPSSEPSNVTGMSRAQPLLCLYQDLPTFQAGSPKRTSGTVPFVWLSSPHPAPGAPNDKGS